MTERHTLSTKTPRWGCSAWALSIFRWPCWSLGDNLLTLTLLVLTCCQNQPKWPLSQTPSSVFQMVIQAWPCNLKTPLGFLCALTECKHLLNCHLALILFMLLTHQTTRTAPLTCVLPATHTVSLYHCPSVFAP